MFHASSILNCLPAAILVAACGDTMAPPTVTNQQVTTRPAPGEAVITIQTSTNVGAPFFGWGGTSWLAHEPWSPNYATFGTWGPTAVLRLVEALGMTDIRLNLPAGVENDADYYQLAWNARDETLWRNDRWAGRDTDRYFFSSIDIPIQAVVNPMRALIQARGETPTVTLHVHGGGTGTQSNSFYDSTADDIGNGKNGRQKMAKRVLEAFKHVYDRYGWIPDGVDAVNEPELAPAWTPAEVADLVYRIGTLLENNRALFGKGPGWRPVINAPSTSTVSAFSSWFDAVWNYDPLGDGSFPNRRYIGAAAWHLYDSTRPGWNFSAVKQRLAATGLPGQMPEYTGLTANLAHTLLVEVPETNRIHRFSLYDWLAVTPDRTSTELSDVARLFRNYTYYVRPGAQRKGVTHNAQATFCNGIPWLNPSGKYVVVVRTTAAGTCWVDQLPAGVYGINFGLGTDTAPTSTTNTTTVTLWNQELPEVSLSGGSALRVVSAGTGVYTIYQK